MWAFRLRFEQLTSLKYRALQANPKLEDRIHNCQARPRAHSARLHAPAAPSPGRSQPEPPKRSRPTVRGAPPVWAGNLLGGPQGAGCPLPALRRSAAATDAHSHLG
eukprot:4222822-Prymnesium_polylepis.1